MSGFLNNSSQFFGNGSGFASGTGGSGPTVTVSSVDKSIVDFSGGSSVVITGSGFTGASTVKFASTNAASFHVDSDTQITATTPALTASATPVNVSVGSGTLSSAIEFFAPTNISGCVQWLRADLGITTSGGFTTLWADQSGQGFDMSSTVLGLNRGPATPVIKINGKPSIVWDETTFSGAGQRLDNTSPPAALTGASAAEGFMIGQHTSRGVTSGVGIWNYGTGSAGFIPYVDGNVYENFCNTGRPAGANASVIWTNPWLYNVQSSAAEMISSQNGTLVVNYLGGGLGIGIASTCTIGNSALAPFDGWLSEVVIYNKFLSDSERVRFRTYSKDRYAFPRPPTAFANLKGWWSADVGVTQTSGAISLITDQSGNGNDLSASGSAQPTLVANTLNGKPIIRFDGVANELRKVAPGITGADNIYFAMVIRATANSLYAGIALVGDWFSGNSNGVIFNGGLTSTVLARNGGPGGTQLGDIGGPTWHTFGVTVSTPLPNLGWVDGSQSSNDITTGTVSTAGDIIIGNRGGAFGEFDLAELVLYSANNKDVHSEIEMYLKEKWNI